MSNRELIEEAKVELNAMAELIGRDVDSSVSTAWGLVARLAAALEAMELPEGWRWTEACDNKGRCITRLISGEWAVIGGGKYPTAREAMAALDATPPA